MCGLVGAAGTLTSDGIKAFSNLLIFDSVRGVDSTGVSGVARNGDFITYKRVGHTYDLMEGKGYDQCVNQSKCVIIGHNRWGTRGKKTNANAHPFWFERIVGAHNGTIDYEAVRKLKGHEDFETDSEALLYNIEENGAGETIGKVTGAWALTWFDRSNKRIFMLRNAERPLHYIMSDDAKMLFWASEPAMLVAALVRNGVKGHKDGIKMVMEDMLYSWEIPTHGQEFVSPTKTGVKGAAKNVPYRYHHGQGYGGLGGEWTEEDQRDFEAMNAARRRVGGSSTQQETAKGTTPEVQTPPKTPAIAWPLVPINPKPLDSAALEPVGPVSKIPSRVVSLKEIVERRKAKKDQQSQLFTGYHGEQLDEKTFLERTGGCCSWCSSDVEFGETVRFFSNFEFLCIECMDDPQKVEIAGLSKTFH